MHSANTPNLRKRWRHSFQNLPSGMAQHRRRLLWHDPEHIQAIANAVRDIPPRIWPDAADTNEPAAGDGIYKASLTLAGLEPLKLATDSLFINVGERTNVTGSAKFARLIRESKFC